MLLLSLFLAQRIILSLTSSYLTWTLLLPFHLEILGTAELSFGKFTMGTELKFES